MRRHAAAALFAVAAATSLIGFRAPPVSAECSYLPPWPPITPAIPSARAIVVGEVVSDFDPAELHIPPDQERAYALRITHVLRGAMKSGDMLDIQFLGANWPQVSSGSGGPYPSCAHPRAAPGEVIALAFDALQLGGPMRSGNVKWIQPPTRYNAMGVIKGPGGSQGTNGYRERVTLAQLRSLAALPQTDTAAPMPLDAVPSSSTDMRLLLLAGGLGLTLALRRFHQQSRGRRVALGGVRRSER